MKVADCFYLGYSSKIIGNNGELAFKLDVDSPSSYEGLDAVFIRVNINDEILVPFFITQSKLQQKGILRVAIEGISNQLEAKKLVGKELYLPTAALPKLKGDQFYYHEIVDWTVHDERFGAVGKIKSVLDYPSQDILQVINSDEKEILIPLLSDTILKVDREKTTLHVTTMEGLIEMYLEA